MPSVTISSPVSSTKFEHVQSIQLKLNDSALNITADISISKVTITKKAAAIPLVEKTHNNLIHYETRITFIDKAESKKLEAVFQTECNNYKHLINSISDTHAITAFLTAGKATHSSPKAESNEFLSKFWHPLVFKENNEKSSNFL
ncbi:hypothetical protein [Photobacterium kishitanii]|uniref:Uncharacterized protein n=1 Tax=Photobacterium kishitanii TaxID=318456 RepID=A0A2T3KLX8_9GAMM|nr:hypothetical protein [Photobacterium kishitanii]PSV00686.1 hypothetical protein C9J27_05975 [Photobacterium kishitanii]